MRSPRPTRNSNTATAAMPSSATTLDPPPGAKDGPASSGASTMRDDERYERAETPTRHGRLSDSLDRKLALYRELRRDLDRMGREKVGTAWHRDRVEQLA